jgi:hypothetical protein
MAGNCLAYKVEISEIKEITSAEMRYPKRFKRMFLIFLAILIFMNILFPILVQIGDAYDYSIWDMALLLSVTLLCLFCCLELYSWYEANDQAIRNHSLWRPHFSLKWEEIDGIMATFQNYTGKEDGVTVEGGGHKFKLRDLMDGWPEFAYLVRKHLPEAKWLGSGELIEGYSQQDGEGNTVASTKESEGTKEQVQYAIPQEVAYKSKPTPTKSVTLFGYEINDQNDGRLILPFISMGLISYYALPSPWGFVSFLAIIFVGTPIFFFALFRVMKPIVPK